MRRVYGLSVYELDPLETATLAANLPAGSLVWQKLETPAAWTFEQYLMAAQIDQMNMWMWGNADPKKRGSRPKPLPRPGQSQPAGCAIGTAMSVEQLDRFMGREFKDTGAAPHNE